ncbi:hypothetical protein PGT21_031438 [Puccinia graminis f. sp. tritici]|uniref:Uncharacterized protein n=1 Tax=Puccinia graminis f. sp. tritici TaxID=56615 RepID=A0A5B0RZB2_PUCGR|nr:hypothetical protein PGT21_031438 [Puccinia graminis f. sp. tritici]KAA1131376.1 hypothetical protein PGTUg99_033109 [Puccinia graminis f. sp. tritici]
MPIHRHRASLSLSNQSNQEEGPGPHFLACNLSLQGFWPSGPQVTPRIFDREIEPITHTVSGFLCNQITRNMERRSKRIQRRIEQGDDSDSSD